MVITKSFLFGKISNSLRSKNTFSVIVTSFTEYYPIFSSFQIKKLVIIAVFSKISNPSAKPSLRAEIVTLKYF